MSKIIVNILVIGIVNNFSKIELRKWVLVYLCSSSSRSYIYHFIRVLFPIYRDPIFSKVLYLQNDEGFFDLQLVHTALPIHEIRSCRSNTPSIFRIEFSSEKTFWNVFLVLVYFFPSSENFLFFLHLIRRFHIGIFDSLFPRVIRSFKISWSFVRFQTSIQIGLELLFISLALSLFSRVFCIGSMVYLINSDDDNIFVEEKYHGLLDVTEWKNDLKGKNSIIVLI